LPFEALFVPAALREAVSDAAWLRAMLEAERALAVAEAKAGVISQEEADAVVVTTDGDNTNLVIAQVAQKQFEVPTVIVRVLDPARAQFYAARGLRIVCPTSAAIETLVEAVRAAEDKVPA